MDVFHGGNLRRKTITKTKIKTKKFTLTFSLINSQLSIVNYQLSTNNNP